MLVDAEHLARDNRRRKRLLRDAELRMPGACLEDVETCWRSSESAGIWTCSRSAARRCGPLALRAHADPASVTAPFWILHLRLPPSRTRRCEPGRMACRARHLAPSVPCGGEEGRYKGRMTRVRPHSACVTCSSSILAAVLGLVLVGCSSSGAAAGDSCTVPSGTYGVHYTPGTGNASTCPTPADTTTTLLAQPDGGLGTPDHGCTRSQSGCTYTEVCAGDGGPATTATLTVNGQTVSGTLSYGGCSYDVSFTKQ